MSTQLKEEKRIDRILKYHEMGLNLTEIGKLVDCTKENVRKQLLKLGLHSPVCYGKNRKELSGTNE